MSVEQVTRFKQNKACGGCGKVVPHVQVASFDNRSGFKTYDFVPSAHRSADGTQCSFKSDLREAAWAKRRRA